MQKSIIIDTENGNASLNCYLKDGWKVVAMSGMPSSCTLTAYQKNDLWKYPPTCLVIIEKVD